MSDTATDHIHVGKDGWLFVVAGSNNVIAQFNESGFMAHQTELWRQLIAARAERARGLGIAYRHVVVPEKLCIYENFVDGIAVDHRLSPARRLIRGLPRRHPLARLKGWLRDRRTTRALRTICVDLVGPMRAARARADLFYRTDSHWTFAGCHLAYREICRALRASPREDLAERGSRETEIAGDLGSRFDPPRTERARIHDLQRDAVRSYASPIVAAREAAGRPDTLHVGSHVIYRNASPADPRRLVLFGDSYAHFAPLMLTIMLAETFAEVHFIWSTAIDWSYVEAVRPDIVLTEIAERFMFRVPDDSFSLIDYAAERFGEEVVGG
ncbi:alginate O-acetyltransferase AlgX-related protein [Methylorubrum zatmanii]|uniref:AlgX/AlgJ SGNH hydrolase-like domain-containing protein n=2 Tax=Methylorubrum zatmanii TaxID=29429 RepID=A0ABW1WTU4_9HYPH